MAQDDDSQRVRSAALAILRSYEETKATKSTRQAHAAQIPSIPPQEKTSPSKPLPPSPKAVPASRVSNTPQRSWFLWGGIGMVILISIAAYVLNNFAAHPSPSDTPTSSLTAPMTETLSFTQAVASTLTNIPTLFTTDTPILPTTTPMLPTGTLVPTITTVPSNTPTNTPTPTQVPPTRTPTMTSTTTVPPTRTPFTGNIAPQGNRSRDGIGSGNAFDGNLSTFWADGLGHRFTLTLSLPGSFDVNRILVWDRPQNSPDNQQINQLIISLSNGWSKRFDMNSGGPLLY